ncbi:MAG: glycosyltransferase family 4 protein [Pseudomonadota bacterium]
MINPGPRRSDAPRIAALLTHPIQYYSPFFAALATRAALTVYYAHAQDGAGQAAAGFGSAFDWDVPLFEGYEARFLTNVARQPGLGRFRGCDTPEIGAILARERFDALFLLGWNHLSLVQGWIGARRAGAPVLLRLDNQIGAQPSGWRRAAKRALYPAILSWGAGYLSPGARTDAFLRAHGAPPSRIHRLPHMIDVARFSAGAEAARRSGARAARRRLWGAAPDETVFLFVGKLIQRKRPALLLEAFKRSGLARARLVFVGEGPLRPVLEAAAAGDDRVRFAGFANQTALPEIYAAADCLALPSNGLETWGLVVNEAQACGLPAIVSSAVGCGPDLIEEGVTGSVFPGDDADALADRLRRAAETPLAGAAAIRAKAEARRFETGAEALLNAIEREARRGAGDAALRLPPLRRAEGGAL